MEHSTPQFGFSKHRRLRQSHQFESVFQHGLYAADDTLVINAQPNERGHHRLGLSIGRKVGNAVVRNRWKRAIREAFRTQFPTAQLTQGPKLGLDLVVRPRKGASFDSTRIADSLKSLIERLLKKMARMSQSPSKKKNGD